jgi:hypothetical protein
MTPEKCDALIGDAGAKLDQYNFGPLHSKDELILVRANSTTTTMATASLQDTTTTTMPSASRQDPTTTTTTTASPLVIKDEKAITLSPQSAKEVTADAGKSLEETTTLTLSKADPTPPVTIPSVSAAELKNQATSAANDQAEASVKAGPEVTIISSASDDSAPISSSTVTEEFSACNACTYLAACLYSPPSKKNNNFVITVFVFLSKHWFSLSLGIGAFFVLLCLICAVSCCFWPCCGKCESLPSRLRRRQLRRKAKRARRLLNREGIYSAAATAARFVISTEEVRCLSVL